jgi:hypothetical protein
MTLLLHWDGTSWSIAPSPNPTKGNFLDDLLFAGVVPSPGNVWILGNEDEGLQASDCRLKGRATMPALFCLAQRVLPAAGAARFFEFEAVVMLSQQAQKVLVCLLLLAGIKAPQSSYQL